MQHPLPLILTAILGCAVSSMANAIAGNDDTPSRPSQTEYDYPVGDARRCHVEARRNGKELQRFHVLPGFGWDNLRNVNEGQVVIFNYSQCRSTEDGRFLLPDSVSAIPVKSSRVHTFAELINHWKSWVSSNSKSINVNVGLHLPEGSFSGRFSTEFQDIKSKQIGDKSITVRAQLRYIRYLVQLQPDTPLHPVFKSRVLSIGAAHEVGDKEQARYLSQLLVRDFGTHIVTKADAGAALEKVDQVQQNWATNSQTSKTNILAAASVSLFKVFSMSTSFKSQTSEQFIDSYDNHMTSSKVVTQGGPVFLPGHFTTETWARDVETNLVAMDRSGVPLHYVITRAALPELPASVMNEVYEDVKEAVEAYYSFNSIPGCLDPNSPNYSPAANTEDDSCNKSCTNNMKFGGVYQTCALQQGSNNGDLCRKLSQKNPLTRNLSCPTGYKAIKLYSGITTSSRTDRVCRRYWIFWHKCHDNHYTSRASYDIFWCVATDNKPLGTGYLFGGLFTDTTDNPVTQSATCPPDFFQLHVGSKAQLHICINDDMQSSRAHSLPFAGFISCQAGNPLAVANNGPGNAPGTEPSGSESQSLKMFFKDKANEWPMRCPHGYSRHVATEDQGCRISYCIQTMTMIILPAVKRPPFISAPSLSAPSSDGLVMFNPKNNTWKAEEEGDSEDSESLSPAAAAGIAVSATLAGVFIVMALVKIGRRVRKLQSPK